MLAPAGDMEKLKMAVLYGADAVYLGSSDFSLRAQARNFDREGLIEAVAYAHGRGVKVYLTVNVYAHEEHLPGVRRLLREAAGAGVDAFIIADPGVLALAQAEAPQTARHLSTQASCTNSAAARFWLEQGVSRVILGREVSLADMGRIARAVPELELEIFVHGAICMSYSGRCLLSSFLTRRSANLGDCAQPCRWLYRLEEAKRPGAYMPIEEDRWGSYILNSKDLCLLELLPEVLAAGVSSLKIEGRMKSAYYVANVVRVYREALDSCWAAYLAGERWEARPDLAAELRRVSHRQYFTGFALGQPNEEGFVYDTGYAPRSYDFAGVVLGVDQDLQRLHIEQRNNLRLGDRVEIILPGAAGPGAVVPLEITAIWDEQGEPREALPHARETAWLELPPGEALEIPAGSVIRRPSREVLGDKVGDKGGDGDA